QASPCQLEVAATALPGQQVVARARRHGTVRLSSSPGDPLPLPRDTDPDAMGRDQHRRVTGGTGSWRAGCGGSRTSGSGDGPEKPTRRNGRQGAPVRSHWATDALDVERRRAWNAAAGRHKTNVATGRPKQATGPARSIKRARY